MAIHLCGLPGSIGWAVHSLLGLAPGGVCRAVRIAPHAGALLPHRFTLTCDRSPGPSAVSLCCTVRQVAPTWLSPASCPAESRLSSTQSMLNRGHPFDSPSAVSLRLLFDDNDGPVLPLRIRENLSVARKEFLKALLLVVDAEPEDLCHLRGC